MPLRKLRQYDTNREPLVQTSPRWALGRTYMGILLVLCIGTANSTPVPYHLDGPYDVLAYVAVVSLVCAILRPYNTLLRRLVLLFLCLALGARATFWILVATGFVSVEVPVTWGQNLTAVAYPSAVAFGSVMVLLLTEGMEAMRSVDGSG